MNAHDHEEALTITYELSPRAHYLWATRRELAIYLAQYAQELRLDLGIPARLNVDIELGAADEAQKTGPFRLLVDGLACRSRRWPCEVPEAASTAAELATDLAWALHHARECLLTAASADRIARCWNVRDQEGYRQGWSARSFHSFLLLFINRCLNIERAKGFVAATRSSDAAPAEAALFFEEAIEQLCFDVPALRLDMSLFVPTTFPDAVLEECCSFYERWLRLIAVKLGVVLPPRLTIERDRALPPGDFRFKVIDVRLPPMRWFGPDEIIVLGLSTGNLQERGIECRVIPAMEGTYWTLVPNTPDVLEKCRSAGLTLCPQMTTAAFITDCGRDAIEKHAGSFVAAPMVRFLLDLEKRAYPGLVSAVQTRVEKFAARGGAVRWLCLMLSAVMRNLLDERVSIRDLHGMLEGLLYMHEVKDARGRWHLVYFHTPSNAVLIAEKRLGDSTIADFSACARLATRSLVRQSLPDKNAAARHMLILDPELQRRISEAIPLAWQASESRQFLESVFDVVSRFPDFEDFSLVVPQAVRSAVRHLLRVEFPELSVLGSDELPADVNAIEPIIIRLPPAPSHVAPATGDNGVPHQLAVRDPD